MSRVEPSQVAALLGREIDTGFAAALLDLGSSRALVVERIVARVGAVPGQGDGTADTAVDWGAVPWQAEVTLRPTDTAGGGSGGEGGGDVVPSPGTDPTEALRHRIALLRTLVIRGVGPSWEAELAEWGHRTVGDLAAADPGEVARRAGARASIVLPLLSRARDLVAPWPAPTPAASGRTIAEIAAATPEEDTPAAHMLRAHCLRLVAALDAAVAATLVLP